MAKMTDRQKRAAKRKRERKKKWAPRKQLGIGFTIGLMLFVGLLAGVSLSIDTSVVNQLQQITMTTRTNDMFNPIVIGSTSGVMKIELTHPILNGIDPMMDRSDVLIQFGRIENPIFSVFDWVDRGQWLNDLYLSGDEYDDFCDNMNPAMTHWTHFYIEWDTGVTLMEDYTYVLILDFYDADGEVLHCCEELWEAAGWFEGIFPPLEIRQSRPAMEGLQMNVDPGGPEEDYIQGLILDCDYISFFEYVAPTEELEVTPTETPTGTGDGDTGPTADGWMNQFDILPNMKNGTVMLILILILGLLGLLIFFILFFKKKKDEDKKKGGK